jgi:hypothetical protein
MGSDFLYFIKGARYAAAGGSTGQRGGHAASPGRPAARRSAATPRTDAKIRESTFQTTAHHGLTFGVAI